MPSLWNRMREIVTANGHARLDAMEQPALMSQQLLREIDDELQGIRAHLLAALSRLRQIQHSREKLEQSAAQHDRRARTALQQGDETVARHHLGLRLKLEAEVTALQELAQGQQQWIDSLKTERASLLREREEMASQARVIQLRQGLGSELPQREGDPYGRVMRRRERMQGYAERVDARLHDLHAAQELRAEELGSGELPADSAALDVDAALAALKHELTEGDTP